MSKALIVYATRTNETQKIAELIAEGMRINGLYVVDLVNVNDFNSKGFDPESYDALVLGSPTYNGEMLQSMKTFLFAAEKWNLEGKVGGAFGSFGWSGEAPERIFQTMRHIYKLDMVSGPLMLKSASLGGGIKMAHEYGGEIAKKAMG